VSPRHGGSPVPVQVLQQRVLAERNAMVIYKNGSPAVVSVSGENRRAMLERTQAVARHERSQKVVSRKRVSRQRSCRGGSVAVVQ